MAEAKKLLKWRKKQPKGAIMKSTTFKRIYQKALKEGLSEESAKKVAGNAYWNTAEAKFRKTKKGGK